MSYKILEKCVDGIYFVKATDVQISSVCKMELEDIINNNPDFDIEIYNAGGYDVGDALYEIMITHVEYDEIYGVEVGLTLDVILETNNKLLAHRSDFEYSYFTIAKYSYDYEKVHINKNLDFIDELLTTQKTINPFIMIRNEIVAICKANDNLFDIYYMKGEYIRCSPDYTREELITINKYKLPTDKSIDDMMVENIKAICQIRLYSNDSSYDQYGYLIKETSTTLLLRIGDSIQLHFKYGFNLFDNYDRIYIENNLNFIETL